MFTSTLAILAFLWQPQPEPLAEPSSWFTLDDYPVAARRAQVEGRVAFRLEVDERGRPRACSIVGSSGHALLDATACRVAMRRARFHPQTPGAAVERRSFDASVTWALEAERPLGRPVGLVARMWMDLRGTIRCQLESDDGDVAEGLALECERLLGRYMGEMRASLTRGKQVTLALVFAPPAHDADLRAPEGVGELLVEAQAELRLARNGRVESCRMLLHRPHRPAPFAERLRDLCALGIDPEMLRWTVVGVDPPVGRLQVALYEAEKPD